MPFFEVLQIQFIDRVCPSSCEQRQVSTELQFLDKVVDELVLCNDRCSKGFAHRQGRRRASGHAAAFERISCVFYVTVNLDPEVDFRFAWKCGFPRAPCIWQSLPAVLMRPV